MANSECYVNMNVSKLLEIFAFCILNISQEPISEISFVGVPLQPKNLLVIRSGRVSRQFKNIYEKSDENKNCGKLTKRYFIVAFT